MPYLSVRYFFEPFVVLAVSRSFELQGYTEIPDGKVG